MTRTRLLALPALLLALLAVPSGASAATASHSAVSNLPAGGGNETANETATVHPRVATDTAYGLSFASPCRTRLVVRSTMWVTHYGLWSGGRLIGRGLVGPRADSHVTVVHNLRLRANQQVSFQARPDWGTFILTVYANPKPCPGAS